MGSQGEEGEKYPISAAAQAYIILKWLYSKKNPHSSKEVEDTR